MARPIYSANVKDLIKASRLKIGSSVFYALSNKRFSKTYYEVKGPSKVTTFREWNGKLQLKTSDNDACWIYAKLCFKSRDECLAWVTKANNEATLHGSVA